METFKMFGYCLIFSSCFFYAQYGRIKGDLKNLNIIDKYYPKHYIQPQKWMKKFLKIKLRHIPKLFYFQCYFIFFYLISTILCWGIAVATDEFVVIAYCFYIQIALNLAQGIVNFLYGAITKIY